MERHPFKFQVWLGVALILSAIRMTLTTSSNAQDGFCRCLSPEDINMKIVSFDPSTRPGYLSIDCGSTQEAYIDDIGLNWVNDGKYISTGMNGGFDFEYGSNVDNHKALQSFRYFPEQRNKYCYELPTTHNTSYLLRAMFYYNTTEALGLPIQFTVSVNATNWFTMTYGIDAAVNTLVTEEGVFYSPGGDMYLCLTPSYGAPFISSIELRPLDPAGIMYSYSGSTKQYLTNLIRYNVGAAAGAPTVRFPDDAFDRLWSTPGSSWANLFPILQASPPLHSTTSAAVNNVPAKVMQDAWEESSPYVEFWVDFPLSPLNPVLDYAYVAVYFEDLLPASESGGQALSLTVTLDGADQQSISVSAVKSSMLAYPNFVLEDNSINISLSAVGGAGSGPTINAVEVYAQNKFNFSTTATQDDQVIQLVKDFFNMTDWQGDPCTPVPYEWLTCASFSDAYGSLCVSNGDTCTQQQGYSLRKTSSVTALTLQNLNSSGFSSLISKESPRTFNVTLDDLTELSITESGVDNTTFQFLVRYFVGTGLTKLDLSNNAINNFPLDTDWDGKEDVTFLNLSNNALVGELPLFDDLPFGSSLEELDVSHNAMTSLPALRSTTMRLVILDLSYNSFAGDISSLDKLVNKSSGSLRELNVSNNSLTGTFSSALYFSSLKNLTTANFAGNQIEGTLDLSGWLELLQEAVSSPSKESVVVNQLFSFVNNSISDIIPSAEAFQPTIDTLLSTTTFDFVQNGVLLGGNPYCNRAKSQTQLHLCRYTIDDIVPAGHRNRNKLVLILGIIGGLFAFLGGCVLLATIWKLWKQVHALRDIQQALADQKVQPPFFSYNDLKSATRNFHMDSKLGLGAFGIVYLGVLADGTKLGVKKLFNSALKQVLNEFLNEVVLITGIKHKNLVQLKGCCVKDNQRILVYEYVENGNLAEALWGSKKYGSLDWKQCWEICVGVARGLSYLHEELQPSIIHRDIKPANILLDMNYKPKIADFGLARPFLGDQSQALYTQVAGTLGYFSPEYATQGQLTEKADVYSYGIVVLEVVSGRKCIDYSLPVERVFLKDWAHTMHQKGTLLDLLQPHLRGRCREAEVIRAVNIALLCVQADPVRRPTMSQVVTMFLGSMDVTGVLDKGYAKQPDFKSILGTNDVNVQFPALKNVVEGEYDDFPLIDINSQYNNSTSSTSSSVGPHIELINVVGR